MSPERIALIQPRVERLEALSNNKKKKNLGAMWGEYKSLQERRATGMIGDYDYWDMVSEVLHAAGIEVETDIKE